MFSEYQVFDVRIETNDFIIEWSSTKVKNSNEVWMIEVKHVVTENHEFEYREYSNLLVLLRLFGPSTQWCKDGSKWKFF